MRYLSLEGGRPLAGELVVQGAKNIFLGGEGLFNTIITGPGKIWLQSMPISNVARALSPYMMTSSGDGGINIRLGDN